MAPTSLRDRGPEPDALGMEALPATGDLLSRDVPGVAHRLKRSGRPVDPCQTVRNCSLSATIVGPRGGSSRALQSVSLSSWLSGSMQERSDDATPTSTSIDRDHRARGRT